MPGISNCRSLFVLMITSALLVSAALAGEKGCVSTDSIENLSEEEYFHLYES